MGLNLTKESLVDTLGCDFFLSLIFLLQYSVNNIFVLKNVERNSSTEIAVVISLKKFCPFIQIDFMYSIILFEWFLLLISLHKSWKEKIYSVQKIHLFLCPLLYSLSIWNQKILIGKILMAFQHRSNRFILYSIMFSEIIGGLSNTLNMENIFS